jgi:DNA-binding XRE family transcriptional regulator
VPASTIESALRRIRRERRLRHADLAWLIRVTTGRRVSASTLSRLERGIVDSSAATKAAIARSLNVPAEELWSNNASSGPP